MTNGRCTLAIFLHQWSTDSVCMFMCYLYRCDCHVHAQSRSGTGSCDFQANSHTEPDSHRSSDLQHTHPHLKEKWRKIERMCSQTEHWILTLGNCVSSNTVIKHISSILEEFTSGVSYSLFHAKLARSDCRPGLYSLSKHAAGCKESWPK